MNLTQLMETLLVLRMENNKMKYSIDMLKLLRPENGEITFVLNKQKMISSLKENKEQEKYLALKNKGIVIFVDNIKNNKFRIFISTTYIDRFNNEFTFDKGEDEKTIKLEWTKTTVRIFHNGELITEKNFTLKEPGGTLEVILSVPSREKSIEQYILDIGEMTNKERERISLFLDNQYSLNFRIVDLAGREYSVKQELSNNWNLENWHKIKISWSMNYIKMRVHSSKDENSIFDEVMNDQLDNMQLFYLPINPPMIIGTDLSKQKFCKMTLSNVKLFNEPKF